MFGKCEQLQYYQVVLGQTSNLHGIVKFVIHLREIILQY